MRILPPDDPTAVYPIGQLGPLDEEEDEATDGASEEVTAPVVPPIEVEIEAPVSTTHTGFNPLIAIGVLAVGALLAAFVIGAIAVILLLIQ